MEEICQNINNVIFDLVEGNLPKEKVSEYFGHINTCEDCRNEYERSKKTLEYIKQSAFIPPKKLKESVLNIILTKKKNNIWKYSSTIAACIVIATVLINVSYFGLLKNINNEKPENTLYYEELNEDGYLDYKAEKDQEVKDIEETENVAETTYKSSFYGLTKPQETISETNSDITSETRATAAADNTMTASGEESISKNNVYGTPEIDNEKVVFYTSIYASEYENQVFAAINSSIAYTGKYDVIKEGSNYNVYLIKYTKDNFTLFKTLSQENQTTLYSLNSEEEADENYYLMYIQIK